MTDKQIIIDGVDITNCIHRATNKLCGDIDPYCRCYTGSCKDIPNCYYKQLKRLEKLLPDINGKFYKAVDDLKAKEQECEMWKNLTVDNGAVALKYQQQLDQLKAEVKSKTEYIQEQRDIINQYSKEIEMYKKCQGKRASKREEELKAENEDWQKEYWKLEQGNDFLAETNSMLKQTITEIKEIAEKGHKEKGNLMRTWWFKDILQKISECEVE